METNFNTARTQYVSPSTREKVHKLLKCAFKQAVFGELLDRNPFDFVDYEKPESEPIAIWTPEQVAQALEQCEDRRLSVTICLAFTCTLRIGEIIGLTWDNVHLSESVDAEDTSYLWIDRALQRVSVEALRRTRKNDVLKEFAPKMLMSHAAKTVLVMKKPKTKASIRKVYLPATVVQILCQYKQEQEEKKRLYGLDYQDHDLVICNHDGTPYEEQLVMKSFRKLIRKTGLPSVVFHSIRHTSTSYKLILSKGDVKSVQADTGHSTPDQIMKRYARVFDNQRQKNARVFDQAFFSQTKVEENDVSRLIEYVKQSPQLQDILWISIQQMNKS